MMIPIALVLLAALLPEGIEPPKSLDPALTVELVAAEPQIVTPVGIAVDDRGRVLVIESHTHFRPKDYDGPPADRIRSFADRDGDGTFETVETIFEGTRHTMGLAVERDGSLLVATRNAVFRLRRDEDGHVVGREDLARLETPGDYPHNGLAGFAIDLDGTISFGFGENLGASYTLIGRDGTTLTGGGEGGNVYRMRPDGSKLARVATGFWNPFHQALDPFGRLFAVDNDPDARPPCRLLHVVEGGDYGFRFRNGRRGLHPFTAWDGELPGTLPMAAGTGEAPSGLIVYESDNLPDAYRGTILATSWGDHRIERYRLEPHGASVRGVYSPVIQGGNTFRPVGIAVAPDGSLFITDWVDRSYELHGKGRIWRIRARDARPRAEPADSDARLAHADRGIREAEVLRLAGTDAGKARLGSVLGDASRAPRTRALALMALLASGDRDEALRKVLSDSNPELRALALRKLPGGWVNAKALSGPSNPAEVRAEALRRLDDRSARDVIRVGLADADAFIRQAAIGAAARSLARDDLETLAHDPEPSVRAGALVALREVCREGCQEVLTNALKDADPTVRLVAMQWAAEADRRDVRDALRDSLHAGPVTERLFAAYCVAVNRLTSDSGRANPGEETPSQALAARLALDATLPGGLRARAVRAIEARSRELSPDGLAALLGANDPAVRIEAVRLLARRGDTEPLAALARATDEPDALRAEAVAGLAEDADDHRDLLLSLAADAPPPARRQAARSLRGLSLTDAERRRLGEAGVADLLEPGRSAPELDAEPFFATPGDADEGRRVFFHPKGPGCFRCHRVEGTGERIGPDLSTLGRSTDPRRILESIVTPGREIAPQYTAWRIARRDGTIAVGQIVEDRGSVQVYADAQGARFEVPESEVEERAPLPNSIMPDDLVKSMTLQELRDLVEFLKDPGRAEVPASAGP
jgi:putative membrane-bound dehydrogenase-like protein